MNLRDRWRYSATNTRFWNWRNRRNLARGRRDFAARAGDEIRDTGRAQTLARAMEQSQSRRRSR